MSSVRSLDTPARRPSLRQCVTQTPLGDESVGFAMSSDEPQHKHGGVSHSIVRTVAAVMTGTSVGFLLRQSSPSVMVLEMVAATSTIILVVIVSRANLVGFVRPLAVTALGAIVGTFICSNVTGILICVAAAWSVYVFVLVIAGLLHLSMC